MELPRTLPAVTRDNARDAITPQQWPEGSEAEAVQRELSASSDELYRIARAALRRTLGPRFVGQEDLLQAALERVVRTLREGRFSGACSLATWVSVIARRVAIDELRSEARDAPDAERSGSDWQNQAVTVHALDVERQLEARSILEHVRLALEHMDGVTANVLVHHFKGHDLAEIAVSLGISVAAAQSRLVRGRKALRRRLTLKLGR